MKNLRRLFLFSLVASGASVAPVLADSTGKPAAKKIAGPVTLADGAYELSGFFGIGNWREVSLKKAGESESKWVRVGQKIGDLRVESADAARGFAIVNIAGKRYRLNLRGERQALPALAEEPAVVAAGTALSAESNRRIERFQSLLRRLTSEQRQNIMASVEKKLDARLREKSAADGGVEITEVIKERRAAFNDALREALRAPGADGKPGEVPDDLDKIVDESSGGTPIGSGLTLHTTEIPADPANPGAPSGVAIGISMGNLTTNLAPAPVPTPVPAPETK